MRPLIQVDDQVREMTDDEFAEYEQRIAEAVEKAGSSPVYGSA